MEIFLHQQLVCGLTGLVPQIVYWVWAGGLLVGADSGTMTLVPTPREERNGVGGTEKLQTSSGTVRLLDLITPLHGFLILE